MVSPGIAALMLQLGRACPRLALAAQDAASFFLTDSQHLAEPGPGEREAGEGGGGGGEGAGPDPPAAGR